MKYDEFKEELRQNLLERFQAAKTYGDFSERNSYVINGVEERLIWTPFVEEDSGAVPCSEFEIGQLYEWHRQGLSVPIIVEKLMRGTDGSPCCSAANCSDYSVFKDKIGIALINKKLNKEYLRDKPHRSFMDLAITYRIMLRGASGIEGMAVTDEMMDVLSLKEEALFETACAYMEAAFPPVVERFGRFVRISNLEREFGAYALLNRNLLEGVSDELRGDLMILPTNMDEIHVFPLKAINRDKIRALQFRLVEISDRSRFLSENYYIFDRDSGKIDVVICGL